MLDVCTNDDQLGIVLSHEVAHTLLNHAAEQLSYINFLSALLILPFAVMWAFLPNDGIALVADWFFNKVSGILWELPFARHMETEADEVGLTLASKACFDVREAPVFWGKMQVVSEMNDKFEPPELLSTHPNHKTREKHLTSLVPEALKLRSTCGCSKLAVHDPGQEFQNFIHAMQREGELKREQKPRMVIIK
jgi:predicted Zn-dependent protease